MPIHDWTRVDAGIFHHFHVGWISELSRALNHGLLPPDYYALAEQRGGGLGTDLVGSMLQRRAEVDLYAAKANSIVVRHISHHENIAIVEVVSPGNKSSLNGLRAFVDRAVSMMRTGVSLLILDLFPPGPRDPQGIHKAIWDQFLDNDFALSADKPMTLASYIGATKTTALIEPTAVGDSLLAMPLFLKPDFYVPLPLEATYEAAWQAVPAFWRDVMTSKESS